MRRAVHLTLALAILALGGVGLQEDPPTGTDVGGFQRSDEVIQAKIARKQAKLAGSFDQPKNPDARGDFRAASRAHPEGTNLIELQLEARRHTERMPSMNVDRDAGLWSWDWLGPGNIGGRVRAVLLHPTISNIMWVGAAGGGVWKTTNGGQSWYPLQNFLPSLAVSAMVMDPNNPDILYAATGEGLARGANPSGGIFKSFNGGGTWSQLGNSYDPVNAYQINDLAIHPTNGQILFAAVAKKGRNSGEGRVWRSLNGGQDWETVLVTSSTAMNLGIDPDDPTVVLVSYYNGVYRSEINGNQGTWVEMSTGLSGKLPDDTGRTDFSFGVGNDMIYASCDVPIEPGTNQGEIWRSSDNGITWYQRSTPHHLGTQGHYDNVIWLEEGSTDHIMFGGINLYRSLDGGATNTVMSRWQNYHTGGLSAHCDQHVIVPHIDYGNGNATVFFGNDGGIQKSTFGFATQPLVGWVNLANNLGVTQFWHGAVNADGSVILGGTQDNDTIRFRRGDGPQAWYQAETGDGGYCAFDPSNPNIMYSCYPYLQMEKSINGGQSWFEYHNGITETGNPDLAPFVSPFALDNLNPSTLLAGGESIWMTTNGGANWVSVLGPRAGWPMCSSVEISPHVGVSTCFVGYNDGSIWRTENGADTWVEVEPAAGGSIPTNWIMDIEISPHNPNVVLAGLAGYFDNRVWMSFNGGDTWVNRSGTDETALPAVQVNTVTFHPGNPDWIYVGTDLGIYASEDQGQTWSVTPAHAVNEGPIYVEITNLSWYSGQALVAMSFGRGMYECRPLESVYVDIANNSGEEDGTLFAPFNTFGEGYSFIGNGSTMVVSDGDYDENGITINKRITLSGQMGETAIIR